MFLTEFFVCRIVEQNNKVSFDVYDYTLFRKKVKKTHKILESKIQSIVMTFGLSGFFVAWRGVAAK